MQHFKREGESLRWYDTSKEDTEYWYRVVRLPCTWLVKVKKQRKAWDNTLPWDFLAPDCLEKKREERVWDNAMLWDGSLPDSWR